MAKHEEVQPPQPPSFRRKLELHREQLIGIPLLMVLPILGMLGVFGETFTQDHAENAQLALEIDYPARERYKMIGNLNVTVTNLTEQAPVTVTVTFDRSYIGGFSTVTFTPSAARITDDVYVVELTELEAGATQRIEVELQGEKYWRHEGKVTAALPAGEPVQLSVSTIVFP